LAKAKAQAQGISRRDRSPGSCVNHLKQLGLACRLYAIDNEDKFPLELGPELQENLRPKDLICPQDPQKRRSATWADFTPQDSSYRYSGSECQEVLAGCVVCVCTNHQSQVHLLTADGTVQQLPAAVFYSRYRIESSRWVDSMAEKP
jgi:hypothetical protein